MNTTSKQSVESAISLKQSDFTRATLLLTLYYTLSAFLILVASSVCVFILFSSQISLPFAVLPHHDRDDAKIITQVNTVALETREHLVDVLLLVDVGGLLISASLSYFFARRTLWPIEVAYRRQEQFMGNIAHELRTPLAVLRAGAETVLRHPRDSSAYTGFISESLEEVERMTRLSDDLLFLLRHQNHRASGNASLDFGALVSAEVARFTPYAAERDVALSCAVSGSNILQGSSDDLVRLLQNLLKNAIDYNHKGGTVSVVLAPAAAGFVLTVSDTGIGIPTAEQGRVFERFYKADRARTQKKGQGTGLGLAIVKEIVTSHHGTIALSSVEGKGTTVTVHFRA